VAKVHVDQQRELAKQHKVFSIPTLVIYKDGQITARSTGVRPASEILNLI
jgi:thioredoxin 1